MRWIRSLAALVFALFPLAGIAASATQARLLLPVDTVKPGDTFLAGIELTMKPGWHTYWRNGGDSGEPTTVRWDLPTGLSAGEIRWPAPEWHEEVGFITYVYHGTVVLLVPIHVDPSVTQGPLQLSASIKWLECKKLCIPGGSQVSAHLTVGASTSPSSEAARIAAAESRLPGPVPDAAVSAAWEGPPQGEERPLRIHWKAPKVDGAPDFYPYPSKAYEVGPQTERLPIEEDAVVLRKRVRRFQGDWPTSIDGLLVMVDPRHLPVTAMTARLQIQGEESAAPTPAAVRSAPPPVRRRNSRPDSRGATRLWRRSAWVFSVA